MAARLHVEESLGPEEDNDPTPTRFTEGDVPRGKEVEIMVKDKPLRPPRRA